MLKKILAVVLALFAVAAFAAVDVNKADQAQLESIKGIGPAISGKILDERKKGSYKDWTDLVDRVRGVGEGNAAKFSAEGLTVNGSSFSGAPATSAAKKTSKAKKSKVDKAEVTQAEPATAATEPASAAKTKGKRKSKKEKAAEKAASK